MLRCLVVLLVWIPLAGCATLTGPRSEYLRVDSEPRGASVRVNGVGGGCTPALVEVDKAHPPVVDVSVPGQPPHLCNTRMSPAPHYVAADVLLCVLLFPVGCISFIDAAGAWNELDAPVCLAHFAAGPPLPLCTPPGAPGAPAYPPAPGSHD